jgi:hypothetical protein
VYGRGEVLQIGDPRFREAEAEFDLDSVPAAVEAARGIVIVDVHRVADSCGYGVPLMRYEGRRPQQLAWIDRKLKQGGRDALIEYAVEHNAASIDGLPALELETLPRSAAAREG